MVKGSEAWLQTNPQVGAGAPPVEVLRTAGGSPGTHVGGGPRLAGRAGGMTSFLPGAGTETLLFQPLGRHYAMLSLKVSRLCLGRSWFPGQRGLPATPAASESLAGSTRDTSPGLLRSGVLPQV